MRPVIKEKVVGIEFGLLSPEMIKKMAVVKILTPEPYDTDGSPLDGGLMDMKMGVIDPGLRCRVCRLSMRECPGHFGYIELARPVIHFYFAPIIHALLRCTCRECGKLLMEEKSIEKMRRRLKALELRWGKEEKWRRSAIVVAKARNVKVCPHCGAKQKRIALKKPTIFLEEGRRMNPIEIRERLERIPDEHVELFGIDPKACRPEWMVLTLLPIMPPSARPSITLETGQRSEDDLTHKYGEIIRANQRLLENLQAGAFEVIIDEMWNLLQYHVNTLFQNPITNMPPARHKSGRILRTLTQRLSGKEGRFRHSLCGKRVNFSARAVISPDPCIRVEEVGVPYEVAKELTVPERVTEWNIEWLRQLVRKGDEYPGANYVITPDGRRKRITAQTKEAIAEELEPGYIVERHLMDGDIVLMNRQPSLHRMNILMHRVVVLPGKTLRINPCITAPYNADFDGDEMNLHVPQTEEARAEAELLAMEKHIVSPRHGLPIIGCRGEAIIGWFLLTQDCVLSKEEACQLLASAGVEAEVEKERISGKELFSLLLPPDFGFEGRSLACIRCEKCKREKCPRGAFVLIKNGKLLSGIIDAASIGAEKGKLLHKLLFSYGPSFVRDWLYKASVIAVNYLARRGITTALSEFDVPARAREKVAEIIERAKEEVDRLLDQLRKGKAKPYPGLSAEETVELKIMLALNRARNKTMGALKKHLRKGGMWTIIASGTRGKEINLLLSVGCVGQQSLRGKRIMRGYSNRTTSHFPEFDLSPASRGFISSSYKHGLSQIEMFMHGMTGRDTMMDTSIRTPKSGYLQRRLVNALHDVYTCYDGTVRSADGSIIQFEYGEDGVDVCLTEEGVAEDKEKAKITPGECVGIVTAQSIGEPGTQLTLRTKWLAGVREVQVTLGLPRIIEIFDARRVPTTPSMTIYLKKARSLKQAQEIAKKIVEIKLKDVLKETTLDFAGMRIKLKLDEERLKEYGIEVGEVKERLSMAFRRCKVRESKEGISISVGEEVEVTELYRIKSAIEEVHLKGIRGIKQVLPIEEKGEYVIKTAGSNLREVLKLPEVDETRTYSNDIHEVARVLGIEAARELIVREVEKVLKEQGMKEDIRHLMLVADTMCWTGKVEGIGRYGVAGRKGSVLARASFEVPMKHLFEAAMRREIDELNGVVENVMINQPIPIGTGLMKLVVESGAKPAA